MSKVLLKSFRYNLKKRYKELENDDLLASGMTWPWTTIVSPSETGGSCRMLAGCFMHILHNNEQA